MNRGVDRMNIFRDDADRQQFLSAIGRASHDANVDVAAYCLLGNHFHLVLHCPDAGLSSAMWRIGSDYARYFNRRHGRDGPLFKSRFTSVSIKSDPQLVATLRYVHRNPLDLGFEPAAWPWSSYQCALGLSRGPSWLRMGTAIAIAGGNASHRADVEASWPSDVCDAEPEPAELKRRWTAASVEDWLGRVDAALDALAVPHCSRPDLRLLLALDARGFAPADLADPLGVSSAGAVRTRASRARRRVRLSPALVAAVSKL